MLDVLKIIEDHAEDVLDLPAVPHTYIRIIECNDEEEFDVNAHLQCTCQQPFESTKVAKYTIAEYKIIAQGEDTKTVYDVMLSTNSTFDYQYSPGDTIGILTKNDDEDVASVIEQLSLEEICSRIYRVEIDPATKKKAAKVPSYIPPIVQIRKLLTECLDLRAIPKKLFIRALIEYTTGETDKRFLSILCNKSGCTFDDVILKPGFSFVKLLRHLPSCKPPLELLIEHLPRLMPRPYSIANYHSDSEHSRRIRILFSLLDCKPENHPVLPSRMTF
ncbi:methionine synthase reductase isoform X2 [Topomyia yanbarensis]|uniref:methionine synthase reductase isoform X2 n=1 Tax=Topomyia yanbarensis TaxID=2498891 RepID=UPI00273AE0AF|nr:methionine synthase reductase isoform X2 [Topomyia yanbarensis]